MTIKRPESFECQICYNSPPNDKISSWHGHCITVNKGQDCEGFQIHAMCEDCSIKPGARRYLLKCISCQVHLNNQERTVFRINESSEIITEELEPPRIGPTIELRTSIPVSGLYPLVGAACIGGGLLLGGGGALASIVALKVGLGITVNPSIVTAAGLLGGATLGQSIIPRQEDIVRAPSILGNQDSTAERSRLPRLF